MIDRTNSVSTRPEVTTITTSRKKPRNKEIPRKRNRLNPPCSTGKTWHPFRPSNQPNPGYPGFRVLPKMSTEEARKEGDSLDGRCSRSHVDEMMVLLLLLLGNRIGTRRTPRRRYASMQRGRD
ncbi:hypothetical protein K0M31_009518 [Melipona bicolor]|uniref:Uncharacterized protein n=1 Tax=Melipona bicolor TaxID=60889 RepID=A0AA40FNW1_9HYME|nr:hypothetical protein K0M31_009518 [Melipona bicolor]